MNTPQTRKENIIDEINGIAVADPYRWLEDSDNTDVKNWIGIQNQYTNSFIRDKSQNKFSEELVRNFKVVNFSNPVPVKGRYFYT